jgi:hypothetical protein
MTPHNLEETIAVLTRTPSALNALLRGLPPIWTSRDEGEGTWSVYDVIGHLIHGERSDWMVRVRTILESGEAQPFARFNREGHTEESKGKSLEQLLDEFERVRAENLHELQALALQPDDMCRRGLHPALGVVTLSQLLATWAAHDMTHLHQIARIMACQYRDLVGPWSEFLGVLQCAGHSAPA